MSTNKTTRNNDSVEAYLASITDAQQQADARQLVELMEKATGQSAAMWGSAIVGFGHHHYKYESGREGDICAVGFSARKAALTLYGVVNYDVTINNAGKLGKLGKHKLGKGCLYIRSLADVDVKVLAQMVAGAFGHRNN